MSTHTCSCRRSPRISRRVGRAAGCLAGTLLFLAAGEAVAQLASVGFSSTKTVAFFNESTVNYPAEAGDRFASSFATGDFNGDGDMELALGIPLDDGSSQDPRPDAGMVIVRLGSPGGGFGPVAQTFLLSEEPLRDGFRFGHALIAGDFDGDGRDDLAVGIPGYRASWLTHDLGAVKIYYFGADSTLLRTELIHSGLAGFPDPAGSFDELGHALAAGDFDGDGIDDLAIGAPSLDDPEDEIEGGAVVVLHGRQNEGLVSEGATPFLGYLIDQDDIAIPDSNENPDDFGWALAAGNFNGDLDYVGGEIRPFDDLAMSAPGEDGIGAVMVMLGSEWGLIFANSDYIGQGDLGLPGEAGDRFGTSLATGNFDGDEACHEFDSGGPFPYEICTPLDDLVIGTPFEDHLSLPWTAVDAGEVSVLYGASNGFFDRSRTAFLAQGGGTVGESEPGDLFGFAVAAGDFDNDGRDDLVVSHPGEDSGRGAATVMMGGVGGFSSRKKVLMPGLDGVPPAPAEHWSDAGYALATGDFDANGHSDLAIGIPGRDRAGLANVGAATVLFGLKTLFADGFEGGSVARWALPYP